MQQIIQQKLTNGLNLSHLEVIDETHNHNVPADAQSHFKIIAVSEDFNEKPLIQRHRFINQILKAELAGQIHALALHTFTPDEWQKQQKAPESPPCLGGSNAS